MKIFIKNFSPPLKKEKYYPKVKAKRRLFHQISQRSKEKKILIHKYYIQQIEAIVIPETDLTEKIKQFSQK